MMLEVVARLQAVGSGAAGTGKPEDQIITTRQQVMDSIYQGVDSCFDD
jgi:hypothetical protein